MDYPLLITTNQASGAGGNKMRKNHRPRGEMTGDQGRDGLGSHSVNGHISGRLCFRECQKLGDKGFGTSYVISVDVLCRGCSV